MAEFPPRSQQFEEWASRSVREHAGYYVQNCTSMKVLEEDASLPKSPLPHEADRLSLPFLFNLLTLGNKSWPGGY